MARIRGADPSNQGLLSGLFTRIVYVMTRRKVGRVVMPVQLVAHHQDNHELGEHSVANRMLGLITVRRD
jgi:hypothetical protein